MKESRVNDMDLDKRIDSLLKKNKVKNSLVDFIDESKLKLYPLKYISIMTTSSGSCIIPSTIFIKTSGRDIQNS